MIFELNSIALSLALCFGAVIVIAIVGWLYSLWVDEVSIVAPLWPVMVLICTLIFTNFSGAEGPLVWLFRLWFSPGRLEWQCFF